MFAIYSHVYSSEIECNGVEDYLGRHLCINLKVQSLKPALLNI